MDMKLAEPEQGRRAPADRLLLEIADYTLSARIDSAEAWTTARYCLLDALGCGVLALNPGFNRVGLDHDLLVRIPSTAVATAMLGGSRQEVVNALSNAFLDGGRRAFTWKTSRC
jgi:2-methylcitrate dehydratase